MIASIADRNFFPPHHIRKDQSHILSRMSAVALSEVTDPAAVRLLERLSASERGASGEGLRARPAPVAVPHHPTESGLAARRSPGRSAGRAGAPNESPLPHQGRLRVGASGSAGRGPQHALSGSRSYARMSATDGSRAGAGTDDFRALRSHLFAAHDIIDDLMLSDDEDDGGLRSRSAPVMMARRTGQGFLDLSSSDGGGGGGDDGSDGSEAAADRRARLMSEPAMGRRRRVRGWGDEANGSDSDESDIDKVMAWRTANRSALARDSPVRIASRGPLTAAEADALRRENMELKRRCV